MDGLLDEWMDGLLDEWMDVCFHVWLGECVFGSGWVSVCLDVAR